MNGRPMCYSVFEVDVSSAQVVNDTRGTKVMAQQVWTIFHTEAVRPSSHAKAYISLKYDNYLIAFH